MIGKRPRRASLKKRVLLDTNVWSYVYDNNSAGALMRLARTGSYEVQIAPAVLYETLRLNDPSLRAGRIRLMTKRCFHRLMPEAYSESIEILQEIQRIRPDWFHESPDLKFFDRLEKDWGKKTGGFWVRCEKSPEREARRVLLGEGDLMDRAREEARKARKEMMVSNWKSNLPMDKTVAKLFHPVPGWRGDEVEAWRVETWKSLTLALAQPENTYRQWIAPFLELDNGILASADWVEFWLYLADRKALPRQWIRWAHSFSQRFRKVTDGTPGDTQLSTYFLDTDVIVTADKTLLLILEECRPYAPCKFPEGYLIPADYPGVECLFELLQSSHESVSNAQCS